MPSLREYSTRFGLTPERAGPAARTTRSVMHPGPMNRGVEILVDPSELPGAVITQQVTNGVAVRMAVLFDLLVRARTSTRRWTHDAADPRRAGRSTRRASGVADVLVDDGHIVAVGTDRRRRPTRVLDAARLRRRARASSTSTPTSASRAARRPRRSRPARRAAALGGYTAVVAMPNTDPAQDSRGVVDFVRAQGEAAGLCEVLPAGCITIGRAGEQLAPFAELADAGVRIFTDDGNGVQDPLLMRRAMEYSLGLDIVLAQHCEVSRADRRAP